MLSDHLEVRSAIGHELDLVVAALGDASFFAERMARQAEDDGVLLVAWLHGEAVGCVYVWFEDAEEVELRKHLPGVPLLNRLKVVERLRNNRIGTELVHAAERVARGRGHTQLALGIALDNLAAERLYLRLGFAEWPHGLVDTYSVVFKDGREVREPELARILVKDLDGEELAEGGVLQVGLVAGADDLAGVHDDEAVGEAECEVEVLLDEEDGDSGLLVQVFAVRADDEGLGKRP